MWGWNGAEPPPFFGSLKSHCAAELLEVTGRTNMNPEVAYLELQVHVE
jgi:hypothetical protein